MDSQLQRLNMVESQVRPSDVTDRRITDAMLAVPREKFVPAAMVPLAYIDEALPVSGPDEAVQRFLLAPRALAKLVQLAEVGPNAVVLDVGCATGYSTAILARLGARVVGVECDKGLAETAQRVLQELDISNARVIHGRLPDGARAEGPFDVILLNGAAEVIAPPLFEQLKDGGRLVAIKKQGALNRAQVWQRVGKLFDARAVFEAGAPLLPGFAKPPGFVF